MIAERERNSKEMPAVAVGHTVRTDTSAQKMTDLPSICEGTQFEVTNSLEGVSIATEQENAAIKMKNQWH